MNAPLQPEGWLAVAVWLAAMGVLSGAAEQLHRRELYRPEGLLGWPALRPSRREGAGWVLALEDALFGYRGTLAILGLEGLAALGLLLSPRLGAGWAEASRTWPWSLAVAAVLLCRLLRQARSYPFGIHGGFRMSLLVFAAAFLASLAPDGKVGAEAALWFLALQSVASYAAAGWKRRGVEAWRDGSALEVVAGRRPFGHAGLAALLRRHPSLSRLLTRSASWMERAFPLALLLGPASLLFLIWGMLFHAFNGVFLRLPHFFWAWLATYPAIYFCAQRIWVALPY